MARTTQAQQLQQANEEQALVFFRQALDALPDPRRRQGVRYPLVSVVVIALMAMVCGSDDAEAMQLWGETNEPWLATFLDLPHGPPTQDVFLAVFAALNPQAFSAVLRHWAALLAARLRHAEGPRSAAAPSKQLAVDGKTSRRSHDAPRGQRALHTVSAYLAGAGLVLGQVKTHAKSNEITALPELLRLFDLRATTVTTDAMGCQTEVATTVVQGGGQYLLAVKDNQPSLHHDLQQTFREVDDPRRRAVDEPARPTVQVVHETEKGHGRLERRQVRVCHDLPWITAADRWTALGCVVEVTRERTVLTSGQTSHEVAYYIGSDPALTAAQAAAQIRSHWQIENGLHWVLDMAFREDEARHRAGNTAQNFALLRHFALNLIKADPSRKLGVATCRKRAGWDRTYLIALLKGVSN